MKSALRRLLVAVVALAGAAPLGAEPGLTAAPALRKPIGARASAMGGAFTAAAGGLDSLSYNPAGLSGTDVPALTADYARGLAEDNFSFVGYAHPLSFGVLAVGMTYYDAGKVHLQLSSGVDETVRAQSDLGGLAALSVPLSSRLAAGGLFRCFRQTLAERASASGCAADAGFLWGTPVPGLSFGASLQNLGPGVRFEEEADPLPRTARAGFALDVSPKLERGGEYQISRYLFTADVFQVRDQDASGGLGAELGLALGQDRSAALRVGWVVGDSPTSLTIGFGVREGRLTLDYAMNVEDSFTNTQHITAGWRF